MNSYKNKNHNNNNNNSRLKKCKTLLGITKTNMNSYKNKNHNKNINNNTKTTSIFLGCDTIEINLVLESCS